MTDSAAGVPLVTMREAVQQVINTAEFGYHELTDPEAEAIVVAVHRWCLKRGIDLLEFRG